jgi:hypothetical protein
MQTLDYSIAQMYSKGYIDREEAINRSSNPGRMEKMLGAPAEDLQTAQPVGAVSQGE